MKANPGGIVAPDSVVGRDEIIRQLWKVLEHQSVVIGAERRLGKTSIIKKMQAEPLASHNVIYMDVEGVSTAVGFVEKLAQNLTAHLNASKKAGKLLGGMWSSLGGIEVAGILRLPEAKSAHWKSVLERLFQDLANGSGGKRCVLIWDEFPWMLQKINRNEGSAVVVDLLDLLREMRTAHTAEIRLIYTGSIGLHHVLSSLHGEGHNCEPVNDMLTVEVLPLESGDGADLAAMLLAGEGLSIADDGVAGYLADLVENVPYYIHHVVADLAGKGQPVTREAVDAVVTSALTGHLDQWNLEHYRTRLKEYYKEKAGVALAVLNILAEFQPLSRNEQMERLQTGFTPKNEFARDIVEGDREQLRELIKMMQRDHYLQQDANGAYCFHFNLIYRWWCFDLGIEQ